MLPAFTHLLLIGIVAVSVLLMLVRPFGLPEVSWIGGGALLLVLLRLVPVRLAMHAVGEGIDVYLFLAGMMLLSELARVHGVFHWLSTVAVRHARGSALRLFTIVFSVGTAVTVFMSNDATAIVLTPAILVAVRKAKVNPMPCLFACALIANAASFVLPISNPANLVVFHNGMPPLGEWLRSFGIPSVLSILSTYAVMRLLFRKEFLLRMESEVPSEELSGEGKTVVAGLAVTTVVLLAASFMGKDLGLPTCLSATLIAIVVSMKSRMSVMKVVRGISWSTLALVAGLFILVDAVESIGALRATESWLTSVQRLPSAAAALITGFGVGIANNIANNLPVGLIAAGTLHATQAKGLIVDSVLIGVDLGPNLSVTGSLATILWLIAMRREGVEISAWDFLKIGIVAMPVAMLASLLGAILMRAFD